LKVYHFKGHALLKLNKLKEANKFYKQAIQISPLCYPSVFNIGHCLIKLNRNEEAIQYLEKSNELKKNFKNFFLNSLILNDLHRLIGQIKCYVL